MKKTPSRCGGEPTMNWEDLFCRGTQSPQDQRSLGLHRDESAGTRRICSKTWRAAPR